MLDSRLLTRYRGAIRVAPPGDFPAPWPAGCVLLLPQRRGETMPTLLRAIPRLEALEERCLLQATVPFTLGGDPRVHPSDFRVTVFASGLNYPYSMEQLSDGSLLAGISTPRTGNLYDSVGKVLRLVDANGDGVADDAGTVVYNGLPGVVTSVKVAGNLCLVLSSQPGSEQIAVLRFGAHATDPLTLVGTIRFSFLANWEHTTFELTVRPTPGGGSGDYDVF